MKRKALLLLVPVFALLLTSCSGNSNKHTITRGGTYTVKVTCV